MVYSFINIMVFIVIHCVNYYISITSNDNNSFLFSLNGEDDSLYLYNSSTI